MKLAANLSFLWPELPYLDRFEAAGAAGFEAVEVLFPYEVAAKDTQRALLANGMQMVLMNAPPPNYAGGARGFAAQPGNEKRFQYDMRRAFRYAEALRVPVLHVMAGEGGGAAARTAFVRNLRWAAEAAPDGLTLTIEPLCPASMPGYFLNDFDLAKAVLAEVDAPNVALQYDSYHAQMIHGDAVQVFENVVDFTHHIQIGDTPDRGPPGCGTVDFAGLFRAISGSGYDRWISAEYHPGRPTEATLGWRDLI